MSDYRVMVKVEFMVDVGTKNASQAYDTVVKMTDEVFRQHFSRAECGRVEILRVCPLKDRL